MKTSFRIAVPCALLLGVAAGMAQAQNFGPPEIRETWVDGGRTQVWRNGFGECWHSAFGPPPSAAECGPVIAAVTPPPAPAVVVAPPAPLPPKPVVAAAPPPPPAPAPYVAPREPKRDRN